MDHEELKWIIEVFRDNISMLGEKLDDVAYAAKNAYSDISSQDLDGIGIKIDLITSELENITSSLQPRDQISEYLAKVSRNEPVNRCDFHWALKENKIFFNDNAKGTTAAGEFKQYMRRFYPGAEGTKEFTYFNTFVNNMAAYIEHL